MPEGYFITDHLDNGLNWHWWPDDSMNCSWIKEPPFKSTTKSDGHLCIFGALYNNNKSLSQVQPIHSSITLPLIDCSQHSSVVLQFETSFMNRGIPGSEAGHWHCKIEVSPDAGIHWNSFDASFGIKGVSRPNDLGPGESALFRENITEVAAGQRMVRIRITWYNYFGLYFWNLDDLMLTEALSDDLRLDKIDLVWDDGDPTSLETVSYMLPFFQIGQGQAITGFKSWVTNMGAQEAKNIDLTVTIHNNNGITLFQESKTLESLYPGYKDSLALSGKFRPDEKGTYTIRYQWDQDSDDKNIIDNSKTLSLSISDTVYNRAGDQPDYSFSNSTLRYVRDTWDLEANNNHFIGAVFPIYHDCEIDGISAFITGGLADGLIDFGYSVNLTTYNNIVRSTRELLKTDRIPLDSACFNSWVYLPFDKDGESEFIKGGSILYGGIRYSNWHNNEVIRRDKGLSVGGTRQIPIHDGVAVWGNPNPYAVDGYQYQVITTKNLMIRLHLRNTGISVNPDIYSGNGLVLTQNYPNPFTGQTVINYQIGTDSPVRLEITDLTGRKVLVRDEGSKPPGRHQILIQGAGLAPGVYFYTVYAGANRETKRMIFTRLNN